jgi:hypothetical protein
MEVFMSISDEIAAKLQEKLGYDAPDDDGALFKELSKGKIWLYFGKENNGGPWMGFWIEKTAGEALRKNLTTELNNMVMGKNCGDLTDDGVFVYYDIVSSNNSVVDWVVSAMEELERRAKWEIDR